MLHQIGSEWRVGKWYGKAWQQEWPSQYKQAVNLFKTPLRSFLGGIGSRRPAELLNIIEKNVFTYHTHAIGTSKGNNWKSPCFQFPKSQFYCDRCWRWFVPDSSLKILLCSEHVQKINVPALISFVQVNVTTFNTLTIWKSKLMHKTSIVEGIVPQIQRGRPLKQHIQSALHKRKLLKGWTSLVLLRLCPLSVLEVMLNLILKIQKECPYSH